MTQVMSMKIWLPFSIFCLFSCSTSWLSAESGLIDIPAGELLDAYLVDDATNTRKPLVESEQVITRTSRAQLTSANVESNEVERQSGENLEVIELDNYDEEVAEVKASDAGEVKVASQTKIKTMHPYCQQNPSAKECLYSKYLILCRKDPQSIKCQSQLEKFNNFCNTFPRAYKCKKAQLVATCTQQPHLDECKT